MRPSAGVGLGDGALKPFPYRGDIIASHLAASTLNNLAHHRAGAGEPLVLLHGVGESAVGWQPFHQVLSDNYDVIAIAPDGLGTPLERLHQAAALLTGRTMATLLAPNATQLNATEAGRSLFFAMERSRP